jgi:tetraacyldisaccharide 4'-kinase
VWYGNDVVARTARGVLWPFARGYALAISVRDRLYERGALSVEQPVLPVISVGNLTVGGTGKTPFSAWLATRLQREARPAIALRGYGGDEPEVHRRLNPDVSIIVNSDRAAAVRSAKAAGADVVVLDDAFQHRRVARTADIVLLSAEQLMRPSRLLPSGPWREPLRAVGRADLVVITRKSAGIADAQRAATRLRALFPGLPIASVHLQPQSLEAANGPDSLPLGALKRASVVAVAAIGEPGVFARQLEQLGAQVAMNAFRDHHDFTDAEIRQIAAHVPADALAICTLKDAVKLGEKWPGPSRLWYVSQRLVVEEGAEDIERLLQRVLAARSSTAITAG